MENIGIPKNPEVLALAPRENNGQIEQLGQALLLDWAAGISIKQMAAMYGIGTDDVKDLIKAAVDDNILAEIHADVRDAQLRKLFTLDGQLAELFDEIKEDEAAFTEIDQAGRTLRPRRKVRTKIAIIRERRQITHAVKAMLTADTGERGSGADRGDLEAIGRVLGAVTAEVVNEANKQARRVGRLEAEAEARGKQQFIEADPFGETEVTNDSTDGRTTPTSDHNGQDMSEMHETDSEPSGL